MWARFGAITSKCAWRGRLYPLLYVLGELRGRLTVGQQAVVVLILSDGLRGLRAHDAVDRARFVAELGEAALHAGDGSRLGAVRAIVLPDRIAQVDGPSSVR